MPSAVVTLARRHMRHPVNIRAEHTGEEQTVTATAQFVYQAHGLDKPEVVARILQAEDRGLTLVFTRTKREAQRVAEDLAERGFPSSPLHGDMQQVARERALKRFREGKIDVLVATDVAARGIDVTGITHVINYNCPEDDKNYVHRIGRTGRAGASGIAITFVDWADLARWKMINTALGLPYDEPLETYSTSPHLYHDLGIPPGVTGRVVPESRQPVESRSTGKSRSGGPARGRTSDRGSASDRGSKAGEPSPVEHGTKRRSRNRTRTRSGKAVGVDQAARTESN
jgi:superfamily II DNA/RNA helicase